MDFDLKSKVKDESVNGLQENLLVLILGLLALFIFPSVFYTILILILPSVSKDLLNYIAMFLGYGTYITILLIYLGKKKTLSIIKGFDINNILVAIIFALILLLGSVLASEIVNLIFNGVSSNANQDTLNEDMLNFPIAVCLLTVVFAPIAEELIFRFSIFRPLAKKNKILAYLITVLAFAGVHFISSLSQLMLDLEEYSSQEAYGFFFDDLKTLPIYLVASLILTISYDINKNIATNIMVHAFYNLIQVLIMFLFVTAL